MPQKKFVATGILVFDFEFFIGVRSDLLRNAILAVRAALRVHRNNHISDRNCRLAFYVREGRLGCLGHSAWFNDIFRSGLVNTGYKSR